MILTFRAFRCDINFSWEEHANICTWVRAVFVWSWNENRWTEYRVSGVLIGSANNEQAPFPQQSGFEREKEWRGCGELWEGEWSTLSEIPARSPSFLFLSPCICSFLHLLSISSWKQGTSAGQKAATRVPSYSVDLETFDAVFWFDLSGDYSPQTFVSKHWTNSYNL